MHSTVDVDGADGVALVTVTFENTDSVAQRVRLQNRLDGPVLPPRRGGVPEPGWDDDGFEGVVSADSTLALGYACPTDGGSVPSVDVDPESAVAVDVLGRDDGADTAPASPTDAIRQLGPSRPPADAVPAAEPLDGGPRDDEGRETTDERSESAVAGESSITTDESSITTDESSTAVEPSPAPLSEPTDAAVAMAIPESDPSTDEAMTRPSPRSDPSSFLAAAERRIELAERLDGASVREAATALEDADATVDAVEALGGDRARLRRLAARATELADRAADADPDVDALRRVA